MDSLRSALFRALSKSHLPMLRSALGLGVSLAYQPGDPMPVFHAALSGGIIDLDVLRTLEEGGADPETVDERDGTTPLHLAVAGPDSRALDWLIDQGLDVNAQDAAGRTPLMLAARGLEEDEDERRLEWGLRDARILVAAGADATLRDEAGRSALHSAAAAGQTDMVALLLLAGADVGSTDANGDTALHLAVAGGHDGAARALVRGGANVNLSNAQGFTSLHVLANLFLTDTTPAHLRLADALISAGGNLEAVDGRGFTPLVTAAATGNIPAAAVFVARGAEASTDRSAPLRQAVLFEDDDMTDLLLKAGAEVNLAVGPEEVRPLHTAAHEGFLHGVRALLNHGAEVEARNIDGETALLIAARRQKYDVVAHLIEHGANPQAEDHYGCTALSVAEARGDALLMRRLKETALAQS